MAGPIRINKASSEGIRTLLTWHVYYVIRRREEGRGRVVRLEVADEKRERL